MLLSGIPNRWVRFLMTKVWFGSLIVAKCEEINCNTIILRFRALPQTHFGPNLHGPYNWFQNREKWHRCRGSVHVFFVDRSISHGRYRHGLSIHLRENTVDSDNNIERRSTYVKIRSISISTVDPPGPTGKYGPYPRSIRSILEKNESISTVDVTHTTNKLIYLSTVEVTQTQTLKK